MKFLTADETEALKRAWTDKFVRVRPRMDLEYGATDALRFLMSIDVDPPAHAPKAFRT